MEYVNWNQFEEKSTWLQNQKTYGNAYHIPKKVLLGIITTICIITPFTNWIIPIAIRTLKTGITIRWS